MTEKEQSPTDSGVSPVCVADGSMGASGSPSHDADTIERALAEIDARSSLRFTGREVCCCQHIIAGHAHFEGRCDTCVCRAFAPLASNWSCTANEIAFLRELDGYRQQRQRAGVAS